MEEIILVDTNKIKVCENHLIYIFIYSYFQTTIDLNNKVHLNISTLSRYIKFVKKSNKNYRRLKMKRDKALVQEEHFCLI